MAGRWRPAYVELPTDLLGAPFSDPVPAVRLPGPVEPDPEAIVAAARVLDRAERVVIVPGAGIQRARAALELRQLAIRLDAPVLTPITGAGAIPADDPLWAGALNPARPECRTLLDEADAVLVVGCRLDDVETARWTLPLPNLVQIDVDPAAIGRSYPVAAGVAGDARLALNGLLGRARRSGDRPRTGVGERPGRRRPARQRRTACRARC